MKYNQESLFKLGLPIIKTKSKDNLYEFLPSFVGSKKRWVERLKEFSGKPFIEPFCGSAVLSINLSGCSPVLNDADPYVSMILERFSEQIVPEVFTDQMYMDVRNRPDWWRYAFCLQAMSFSGVFRYSKNGYNVPRKKNISSVSLKNRYLVSLDRWRQLKPVVSSRDYLDIPIKQMRNSVVIMDPPYEGSQASYNNIKFDYEQYWDWLLAIRKIPSAIIVFDRTSNLDKKNIPCISARKMRVNGQRDGDSESMAIFHNGFWRQESQLSMGF